MDAVEVDVVEVDVVEVDDGVEAWYSQLQHLIGGNESMYQHWLSIPNIVLLITEKWCFDTTALVLDPLLTSSSYTDVFVDHL